MWYSSALLIRLCLTRATPWCGRGYRRVSPLKASSISIAGRTGGGSTWKQYMPKVAYISYNNKRLYHPKTFPSYPFNRCRSYPFSSPKATCRTGEVYAFTVCVCPWVFWRSQTHQLGEASASINRIKDLGLRHAVI